MPPRDTFVPPIVPPPLVNLRPRDLIDLKFGQHVWWSTEEARHWIRRFVSETPSARSWLDPDRLRDILVAGFREADCTFVTEEMRDVSMSAAEALPPVALRRDSLPTDCGLLYVQGGIPVTDAHGSPYVIEMILWAKATDHLILFEFDRTPFEFQGMGLPELTLLNPTFWPWNEDPCEHSERKRETLDLNERFSPDLAEMALRSELAEIRFLQAAYLIMDGHVSRLYVTQPDRAQRRRWGRRNLVPDEVMIITLRRLEEPGGPSAEDTRLVDWSHRWWVNGHWRRNHRDPDRPIWVNGHIKGPEHKPLVIKHRVNLFRR